jgi:hypothetical protein
VYRCATCRTKYDRLVDEAADGYTKMCVVARATGAQKRTAQAEAREINAMIRRAIQNTLMGNQE